jgi:hypothetical protein
MGVITRHNPPLYPPQLMSEVTLLLMRKRILQHLANGQCTERELQDLCTGSSASAQEVNSYLHALFALRDEGKIELRWPGKWYESSE